MKLIILSAFISVCAAASFNPYQTPQPYRTPYYQTPYQAQTRYGSEGSAGIIRSDAEVNEQGYRFAYETQNGIQAQESGVEANGIQAEGSYSYTGNDGQVYSIRYTADSNGFQPQGAHIPTAPPIPEAIARALQQNAQDEANGIFDDGSYHESKYDSAGSGVAVARAQYQPFKSAFRQPNRV